MMMFFTTTGNTEARGSIGKLAKISAGLYMQKTGNKVLNISDRKWNHMEFSLEDLN